VIWVQDTGVGLPESVRDRIFDPMFAAHQGGPSQGLYFARQVVVDRHRGSLDLESAPGVGTKVTLRIPIQG
jgi:two-component system, NtrC family, sensor kinase